MPSRNRILLIGGNPVASAISVRLTYAGYDCVHFISGTEENLRYHLSFGDAVFRGSRTIDGLTAATFSEEKFAEDVAKGLSEEELLAENISYMLADKKIPVLHDIEVEKAVEAVQPSAIILTGKTDSPTLLDSADLVVGLHPHHTIGKDCHVMVDSRLCQSLGKVFTPGEEINEGLTIENRFFNDPFAYCHSPIPGAWIAGKSIGDVVEEDEALGKIESIGIRSPFAGQVWGIAHSGRLMDARGAVAMILHGEPSEDVFQLDFRERSIAGGILEAVLRFNN